MTFFLIGVRTEFHVTRNFRTNAQFDRVRILSLLGGYIKLSKIKYNENC